jgi:predicted nucleic acid-binding protein
VSPASAKSDTPSLRYVETSALLSALLERDAATRKALRGSGRRVTSTLTLAEAQRAVTRIRASGQITPRQERALTRALRTFAARCDLVTVSDEVLTRAGRAFPVEPVRTLDAVHLATLELLGEPPSLITIVSRDQRVRANAAAMGYVIE